MTTRKPEDLSIEEIKEQMALYQRLYYYKVRDLPDLVKKEKKLKEDTMRKRKLNCKNKRNWKKVVRNHLQKNLTVNT